MNMNIGYSNYKFDKSNNGIPFNFCYKEVNNSNSYSFKYDAREEGTTIERKVVYLEKLPKEITLATKDRILSVDSNKEISKTNNGQFLYRNYSNNINISNNPKMLYRIDKKDIDILNNPLMFYRINKRDFSIFSKSKMVYKTNKKDIFIVDNSIMIYRQSKRATSVIDVINNLEYNDVKEIYNKQFTDYLILDNFKGINKTNYIELKKIIKQFNKTNCLQFQKIRKNTVVINPLQLSKTLKNIIFNNPLQLSKVPKGVVLNNSIFLNGNSNDIFTLRDTKHLELIKRLWWLNGTEPTDKLIIPMEDYRYNLNQLHNDFYEYLSFNTHPIAWGDTWGIDYNIPPSPISIEIMLDMVNIITMLWHYNYINWNSVTGKEAIQLLMELLYNWYTMDTSKPNEDYYRTYRWIRWEAEKVYFLAKDDYKNNGTKYVGILVANLIDYLKIHHFDVVPIQPNIMRMGSIRINSQQGDLLKDLDKAKSKRFYYIETQNFERKKVL